MAGILDEGDYGLYLSCVAYAVSPSVVQWWIDAGQSSVYLRYIAAVAGDVAIRAANEDSALYHFSFQDACLQFLDL